MGMYSLFGYYVPDWRSQCRFVGGSMVLYLLNLILIPKSFQLAFALGRSDEGRARLATYASGLGITIEEKVITKYESSFTQMVKIRSESLFGTKNMRQLTVTLMASFFAKSVVYYTYLWKPDGVFFSFYIENAFNSLMELVAILTCLILADRIGRSQFKYNFFLYPHDKSG